MRDPATISQKHLPHDKGGNDLVIDNDRKNLHSFWDFTLVVLLMDEIDLGITSDTLGEFLRHNVRPKGSWNTRGRLSAWPAQWATDSLRLSRERTYKDVRIVGKRTIPVLSKGQPVIRDGQPLMQTVYGITRPGNYETANREVAREQLAKAGYRLARLLDAIYSSN